MKTVVIHDQETGEIKGRFQQCEAKPDGTIWHVLGMPILIGVRSESPEYQAEIEKAATDKKWEDIAPHHFATIGQHGNLIVEWEEDYHKRPEHPSVLARQAKAQDERANRLTIYLSSRGWGDYSPVEWVGDRRRPTSEIVEECQNLLKSGHDVDRSIQTDLEITALVLEAKRKSAAKDQAIAKRSAELAEMEVPESAIAAYKACGGDPERFDDDIDHPHYWLVKKYADAIEHQGLACGATIKKMQAEMREAAREELAQYGGGEA